MPLFESFYNSSFQHPIFLWAMSAIAFLILHSRRVVRAFENQAGWHRYFKALCLLSVMDAWLTSNHPVGIGALPPEVGKWSSILFVILGDLRFFFWIAVGVLFPRFKPLPLFLGSLAVSLIVPILSSALFSNAENIRVLFLGYEIALLGLLGVVAAWGRTQKTFTPLHRMGTQGFAFMYSLWIISDLVILYTGQDWGYALRVLPNGLCYGGWVMIVAFSAVAIQRAKVEKE